LFGRRVSTIHCVCIVDRIVVELEFQAATTTATATTTIIINTTTAHSHLCQFQNLDPAADGHSVGSVDCDHE
jgi:hypothetical protein